MPVSLKKIGTLEIESGADRLNPTFYRIQQVSIIIMCLAILGALFGFFGSGIFGQSKKIDQTLQISYDKFARIQASTAFRISITPPLENLNTNEDIRIWINQSFFKKMSIKSIRPQPVMQVIMDDKVLYLFRIYSNKNNVDITFILEPEKMGPLHSEIGLMNGEKIKFTQYIYP